METWATGSTSEESIAQASIAEHADRSRPFLPGALSSTGASDSCSESSLEPAIAGYFDHSFRPHSERFDLFLTSASKKWGARGSRSSRTLVRSPIKKRDEEDSASTVEACCASWIELKSQNESRKNSSQTRRGLRVALMEPRTCVQKGKNVY